MVNHTFTAVWAKAIALAWHDPTFKTELLAGPASALASRFGFTLAPNIVLEVKEAAHNHPLHVTLTLPPKPEGGDHLEPIEDFGVC